MANASAKHSGVGLEAEAETLIPYDSMAEPVVGPMEIHCNIVQSFVTTLNTHTVTNNKSDYNRIQL